MSLYLSPYSSAERQENEGKALEIGVYEYVHEYEERDQLAVLNRTL